MCRPYRIRIPMWGTIFRNLRMFDGEAGVIGSKSSVLGDIWRALKDNARSYPVIFSAWCRQEFS